MSPAEQGFFRLKLRWQAGICFCVSGKFPRTKGEERKLPISRAKKPVSKAVISCFFYPAVVIFSNSTRFQVEELNTWHRTMQLQSATHNCCRGCSTFNIYPTIKKNQNVLNLLFLFATFSSKLKGFKFNLLPPFYSPMHTLGYCMFPKSIVSRAGMATRAVGCHHE